MPRLGTFAAAVLIGLAGAVGWVRPAPAEGPIVMELNKAEERDGACRLYFVFDNPTESGLPALEIDLVLFDQDGLILRRQPILAPLQAAHTSVKVYDLEGVRCEAIGKILINEVMCGSEAAEAQEGCLSLLAPTTRGSIQLIK